MSWRKWLIRGLVLSVLGAVATAAFLYERWTNPSAVRRQVLTQLVEHFPGASITLGSAHLYLLGGIKFEELRLARKDDQYQTEFAYFPSGIIYHNKEELVQGRLAVRKMELSHPRLRVCRDAKGHWNLEGITGPLLNERIPTVVVHDGHLTLVDERGGSSPVVVELSNVRLTVINDPLNMVRIEGTGHSELAETVTVRGSWDRGTDETHLTLDAGQMSVGPRLLDRVAVYAPDAAQHLKQLEGTSAIHAELDHHSGAPQPWTYDVRWSLSNGRFRHPELPLPLDRLAATVRCLDGAVTVENLTAKAGQADLSLPKGRILSLGQNPDIDGVLKVTHLPLTSELFAGRLPANLEEIKRDYAPTGAVSLKVDFSRRHGEWSKHCFIYPEDMAICFHGFRYPLAHLGGHLEQQLDPRRQLDVLKIDLVGFTGSERVYIQGTVSGSGPAPEADIHVWGRNIPLDAKLRNALPQVHQKLADQFHPVGLCDVDVLIARAAGQPDYHEHIQVKFHDAAIRYDVFPYPLESVHGTLEIRPDGWEFRDFEGTHRGLKVMCAGGSRPTPRGDGLTVSIRGTDMLLDQELAQALDPGLKPAWTILAPSGRMHFRAEVRCDPNQTPDLDVTLTAANCGIRPTFFPFSLNQITGTAHVIKHQNDVRVALDKLIAHHGATTVTIDHGNVELDPRGNGVYVNLAYLHGNPLVPDKEFIAALPAKLREVIDGIHLTVPVTLSTLLTVRTYASEENPPEIFWDGQLGLNNGSLSAGVTFEHLTGSAGCRGKVVGPVLQGLTGNVLFKHFDAYNQPFEDIHAGFQVQPQSPQVLQLTNLTGRLFGGSVGGEARLEFGPVPHYELSLKALGIRLEDFGRHNLPPGTLLSGQAFAGLYLTGNGEDVRTLSGIGSLDVGPKSRLYNLPLLLDLLKVLGLRKPDGTAFEEAHANFNIRGPRVVISHLDLFGNSFSLRGHGEMNLNGSDIDLDFYAVWAQAVQMLPPLVKEVPEAISKQLLKIQMRGDLGNVRCTKEPVPAVVEPLRAFLDRISSWQHDVHSQKADKPEPEDTPAVQLPPRSMGS